ncbi:MAG: pantoate--beta-alanine ligase [Bacteroidota bacterium]
MQIIWSSKEMQETAEQLRSGGKRIGVVPTMGFLHQGHLSLIGLARRESDVVVTTIFVNPTQFGKGEDFERYPRNLDRDREQAEGAGTDILFAPDEMEMYPEGHATFVNVEGVSTILEGAFRPGHFMGVATVVLKLLNITKPHVAVFGQKDAQQAFVIQKMVTDLNLDVRIHVAPIVREEDGLALSSRNVYLKPDERPRATALYRSLKHAETRIRGGERSIVTLKKEMLDIIAQAGPVQVDYIAFLDPSRFREVASVKPPSLLITLAARYGTTRLIDNILVPVS